MVAPDREVERLLAVADPQAPAARREDRADGVHSVDGTPADCVNLAIVKLLPRRPDLVVSGINRGANLGEDVFYSGTVGGAREGTFFGVPVDRLLAGRPRRDRLRPRRGASPRGSPRWSSSAACRSARS